MVGANGAGKSTLLRLPAGLDAPEHGSVTRTPPNATVGYLPSHLDLPASEQLEQAVESYRGTLLLVTRDRRMLDGVRATRRLTLTDGVLSER